MSRSTPLLTRLLAACGSSPVAPATDDTDETDGTGEPETPTPEETPKPVKVLFVPGFMSELARSAAQAIALVNQKVADTLDGSTAVDRNAEVAAGDHAAPVMITAPLREFWSTADRNALPDDLVGRVTPE